VERAHHVGAVLHSLVHGRAEAGTADDEGGAGDEDEEQRADDDEADGPPGPSRPTLVPFARGDRRFMHR
jgi:hypothetical protein